MDAALLKQRNKKFALRVFKLVESLPKGVTGTPVGSQLSRCASSVGANYRAALRARSKAEFASGLGIALEEADETECWLELIMEGGLLAGKRVSPLLQEAHELTSIIAATRITALKNLRS